MEPQQLSIQELSQKYYFQTEIERDNSKILVWHRERFNKEEIIKSKHIFVNRINIPNRWGVGRPLLLPLLRRQALVTAQAGLRFAQGWAPGWRLNSYVLLRIVSITDVMSKDYGTVAARQHGLEFMNGFWACRLGHQTLVSFPASPQVLIPRTT